MARPATYDREHVLEQAMQAFWNKGFNATSMADLVDATQLNPGSLYGAFRSKESLFLLTLDHYGESSLERLKAALTKAPGPLEGIRTCLYGIAREVADPARNHSCFLVNTVLELSRQHDEVGERVKAHLDRIEALFRQAIVDAQQAGEIPADRDADSLAAFIMCNIWGMRVLGGTSPTPERARAIVDQILNNLNPSH